MAQDSHPASRIRFVVPGQAEGGTRGAGVATHTQDVRIRLGARRGAGDRGHAPQRGAGGDCELHR